MPLDAVLGEVDELARRTSTSSSTGSRTPRSRATKRNNRTDADGPARGRVAEWVGDDLLGNGAFGLACRVGAAVPRAGAADQPGRWPGRWRAGSTSTAPTGCSPARAGCGSWRWSTRCRARRCRRRAPGCAPRSSGTPGGDVPGRGAGGRAPTTSRCPPRPGATPPTSPCTCTAASRTRLLRRRRVGDGRARRAAALGQAAHPRRRATCAGATRASTSSSALRDRLDPERRFGNAYLDRVLGCWPRARRRPDHTRAARRRRRARGQPRRHGRGAARAAAAPARQGAQDDGARRAPGRAGHRGFTCATVREVEGMAAAGLGEDLLLANEVLDARRLGPLVEAGARVTVAVDSAETVAAAVAGGVREVLVDVNVGLPRCGVAPGRRRAPRRPGPRRRPRGARRDGLRGPPDDAGRRRRAGPADRGVHGAAARRARRRRRRRRLRRRHRHVRA